MIVLLITALVILYGAYAKSDVYGSFIQGAGDGLKTAMRVIPYMAAALLMIGMLRSSGAINYLSYLLRPLMQMLGIPEELLTLMLVRPLSGSAALAELDTLISLYGADHYIVRSACAMMGSSETVIYTIALYLGSVQIKKSRYILPIGLLSGIISGIFAAFFCKFL